MAIQAANPSSFNTVVPAIILTACLILAILNYAGVVDLPKAGKQIKQQIKYLFEPPEDDEPEDTEIIKLDDGIVDSPYYDVPIESMNKSCAPPCKFYYEYYLPQGLEMNEKDSSISGTPKVSGTWTFYVCYEDAEIQFCTDNEYSLTIHPKKETSPYVGQCLTKPNPPCYSTPEGKGDLLPTAVGTLTYDYCKCPEGTHDSGGRDTITTPGTTYIICVCD